jgi:signal transduction histidine kinase
VRIHLASNDRQLHSVCQDAFGEILGCGWTLHIASGSTPECDADLYIWDIEPDTFAFTGIDPVFAWIDPSNRWRHFFLVDRSFVQQFRDSLPFSDANLVLKPVTRAALMSFFPDACKRCSKERKPFTDGVVESLRADRDEILQCLMQANLKLQEYDQDRTNFLARAIHEFRAPLTAVTGYCGLLISEDVGTLTDEQRDVLERMQRSAKKLSRMASAMFQLSIAPRAEVTIDLQKGEIRDCIEQALHEIMPPAEEKRLSISVDVAPASNPLYFERMKLEQVLVNLLDNACKFAPRGGSIEVTGYPYYWDRSITSVNNGDHGSEQSGNRKVNEGRLPNSYRIDIRDSGPGVPPAHLTKIFEEYTSYAGGVDRSGGGLGLAICRMIVNQHKGRIWAESTKQGAVFSFVLPFHGTNEAADHNRVKRQHASNF